MKCLLPMVARPLFASLLFVAAALALATCSGCTTLPDPGANPHESTLVLDYPDGRCSGTAVGPHTLLTASHCTWGAPLAEVNEEPAKALSMVHDGNDHVLVTVDLTFEHYSPVSLEVPPQGTRVRLWGNPGGLLDQYRVGYIAGLCPTEFCYPLPTKVANVTTVDIHGWKGDSGAALFDNRGYVVGVVSTVNKVGPTYMPTGVMPFAFTQEQLEAVR